MERDERSNKVVTPTQGEPREFRKHSRESLDLMMSIRNLHIQQWQNRCSVQEFEPNPITCTPNTANTSESTRAQLDYIHTSWGAASTSNAGCQRGGKNNPRDRGAPGKKNKSEWTLNQRQFDQNKTQEISHISPREHLNVFNGEEPSVSYLQLPVKRKEENRFCTRCGEMGHGRHYCQVATWCKFCTSDTHATQACQKYEKFVKDNPIASSRRNTPVQEQKIAVNTQESNQ